MKDAFTIGLLGAGWFGREAHLRNLIVMDDVQVVAASSRSEQSLKLATELVGDRLQTFHDWREVIAIDHLDAVIVALTNDQHYEASLAAFAAGKHVFCEKPLGLSISQCDEIIAAGQTAERVLQVGHEMRFQRLYQKMHEMISRDEIGQPHLMWCREFRGPMRPGWRSQAQYTGGTILEKNCHHFDLFHWMLNAKPLRVTATGGTNVLHDREGLDNAQVLVEYEGGCRATLELCLFAPYGGDAEIGLVGHRGRIDSWNQTQRLIHHRFDLPERMEYQAADFPEEASFQDASGRFDRGIFPQLRHFIECCREQKTPLTDGDSARLTVAVCLAAQESIKRKDVVWMEELFS